MEYLERARVEIGSSPFSIADGEPDPGPTVFSIPRPGAIETARLFI
ncbi:MAG TPA: hypothetical protein VM869_36485 [Enhygromyxa sp.]|nr:hypothetical protein [Enhygromyxa sp.]